VEQMLFIGFYISVGVMKARLPQGYCQSLSTSCCLLLLSVTLILLRVIQAVLKLNYGRHPACRLWS